MDGLRSDRSDVTWQPWLLLACSISIAVLGWVTYKRGRKNDSVLDVAANIQSTYEAQKEINEERRQDIARLRAAHQQCEEATDALRRSNAELYLQRDDQAREIARLKAVVDEHEQTIARHEATINQLRSGTPADRRERER